MLSETENTSGNAASWEKLKEIHCYMTDNANATIYTHFAHSIPILFHSLLLFPFLANIHEFQKEAHVPKIDFCTM